jgi:hypothetical protein
MKTVIILVLTLVASTVQAQWNNDVLLYQDLNEKQLSAMMQHTEQQIQLGRAMVFTGVLGITAGTITAIAASIKLEPSSDSYSYYRRAATVGYALCTVGSIPFSFGIRKLFINKNKYIQLQIYMMKYQSYSDPGFVPGVGLALSF